MGHEGNPDAMIGNDENGVFKRLEDGRVLRIAQRMFNTILTLSSNQAAEVWTDGW